MKLRTTALLLIAFVLTACNFSLAADVTPPPDYVPPTPAPTLGPLFPAEAPSLERGAAIYAEKCAGCHGPAGMGDGAQGKQLPVTVAALALPQVGNASSPAKWYTQVTQGNIDRYMPPFASLNDQQRWDVVAYALSLHTTPEQVALGKQVFESNCANCPLDFFKDQTTMASVSADDLVLLLKNGNDKVTALSGTPSNDDLYAAAAYLRRLSFAAAQPTLEPVTATPTVAASESTPSAAVTESTTPGAGTGTPSVESTPAITETTTPSTPVAISGKLTGSVSGTNVANLPVTLRGYDHASDASGPQETLTMTGVTDTSGAYSFEGVEMKESRIYVTEVVYKDVTYTSEAAIVETGKTELVIPALKVYDTTNDYSTLVFDQVHIFAPIQDQTLQVICVYAFSNSGDKTIIVGSTTEVPLFIKLPAGAQNVGFDITQDSAPLLPVQGGFAMKPTTTPYGFVVYYTLTYNGKARVSQPFALPASSILVLVPDGVTVKSDQLKQGTVQTFQGADYREYLGTSIKNGETLTFDMSGKAKSSGTSSSSTQNLLIGLGGLGLVLILAGIWMYIRSRKTHEEDADEPELEEEDEEFESEEEILDAIIALDDLHRSGKINAEAYQSRRAELKARLKKL